VAGKVHLAIDGIIIEHGSRRLVHLNVTGNPTKSVLRGLHHDYQLETADT
jgi:hypothetical protein